MIKIQGLIISNGNINDYNKLNDMLDNSDYVICADGGIRHIRKLDRIPDIILGDLDSVSSEDIEYIKLKNIETMKFPTVKDETDTELAVKFLIERGCTSIYFLGATGNRLDHTLANVFLLNSLLEKDIQGKIVDDKNEIYLIDDFLELENTANSYVSIIPISQTGIELSISGFFYNLNDVFIQFGSTQGISNEIIEKKANIKIHSGKALIIQSMD